MRRVGTSYVRVTPYCQVHYKIHRRFTGDELHASLMGHGSEPVSMTRGRWNGRLYSKD